MRGRQMRMKYVLALDQGTSSSRAILFDERGAIRAVAQREFRQIYPRPGWVEHDPEDLWRSQLACARAVLQKAAVDPARVSALGIANQRETTVLWDRATGRPVCNAIVWQDRRTAAACERLRMQGMEPFVKSRTGLVIDPYFSATKIGWILQNVPGVRRRAERGELAFGTVDSWLAWRLSGGSLHVTDASNASRTLLYDLHEGGWSERLLELFGVPRSLLPQILPSSHVHGATVPALLGAPIPIAGMAGDQQAALFGQACHERGMAKNTYGTGCFLLLHTGRRAVTPPPGLVATAAAQAGRAQFALEGSVFIGGAVVQWLRDGLGLIRRAADVEKLAASVPDAGGVVLVPAFTGLGAPYWDPYARGAMLGITRGVSAAHVARAALESIAFQSAELLQAMNRGQRIAVKELRVDGGASANNLLLQIQADILGIAVVRPRILETTALGAAYLAGLATGVWPDQSVIAAHWKVDKRFEPRVSRNEAQGRLGEWRRAVERSRDWVQPLKNASRRPKALRRSAR